MFKDCENGFGDICHFGALRGFKRCSSLSGMMISCFLSGWLNQPILVHPVNEYSLPRVSTPRRGDHVHHWEVGRRVPTPWQEDAVLGFPNLFPIYIRVRHRIDWILEATALLKPYDIKAACSKKVNVHKHVHSYKILQTCISLLYLLRCPYPHLQWCITIMAVNGIIEASF